MLPKMATANGYERVLEIQKKIIRLLAEENCTVKEAENILSRIPAYIHGTAPVQFEDVPYEF